MAPQIMEQQHISRAELSDRVAPCRNDAEHGKKPRGAERNGCNYICTIMKEELPRELDASRICPYANMTGDSMTEHGVKVFYPHCMYHTAKVEAEPGKEPKGLLAAIGDGILYVVTLGHHRAA